MSYYNISCEELSYYGVDDNFSVNFDTSFGSCLQTCLYLADVFCDVVVCVCTPTCWLDNTITTTVWLENLTFCLNA